MDSNNKEPCQNNTNVVPNNELTKNETISKQTHQHNFTPQYYPFVHQHPQMLNRSHMHQLQSPLLLNIPSAQQMQYPNATHKHFQYSPQYTLPSHENAQFLAKNQIYVHQHIPRINNQLPQHQNQEAQVWQPQQQMPASVKQNPQEQKENNIKKESYMLTLPPQPQQQQATITPPKTKESDKKKTGSSSGSQLRSPCARRPSGAPVTMQGWLHKQGSEGLMLWKKRWFVLSEYCLFYYKGSAEEKLLGSILLPSYKVSICKPDDKVYRKYAFKCEHTNMRTYILAADSQDLLLQWVHVLNLACNLQTNVESDKGKSEPVTPARANISTETSGANYHQQNSINKISLHTHTSSNTTDLSNSTQQELNQYNQPLYANAPPKPRRLNDGCYSSPSSEMLDKYGYTQYVTAVHYPRNTSKSPIDIYRQYTPTSQTSQHECVMRVPNEHMYREIHNLPQNVDRRTPDTYGRSQLTKFRNPSDYEDIYADRAMYKRPLSPVATNEIKKVYPSVNLVYKGYSPVNMLGPPRQFIQYDPVQLRKSPVTITRPHSADFLEYKTNQKQTDPSFVKMQQPRPKSSLDINKYSSNKFENNQFKPDAQYMTLDPHGIISNLNKKTPNESDNYFYSQERYAEKMRKSAQYLHKIPFKYQPVDNVHRKHKERCPSLENHPNSYTSRSPHFNTTPVNNNNSIQISCQPIRSRSVLSEGSLLCAQDIENESVSPDYSLRQQQYLNSNNRNVLPDQFTRSASARLAHTQEDGKMVAMEGERKREESMKRLLEWKQRMLQSPLNRKAQAQGYRLYSARPENNYIYQNCYPNSNSENIPKKVNLSSRKSVNSLVQYNSYSSDDEDNGERSKKNMHSQAGWTVDTFPNNSDSLTHAHATSTTAGLKEPEPILTNFQTNVVESHDAEVEDVDENTLTKPLKQFNKDSSTIAHVSSLKSEYSDKFQSNSVTTEIKANDALVKSILSEFQDKDKESPIEFHELFSTPTKDVDLIIEGNYMPMTPKKSVLLTKNDTSSDLTLIDDEQDENHYVEMTQNVSISVLDDYLQSDPHYQQQYEMVCFGQNIIEPVYMELKGPNPNTTQKKPAELPDILKAPKRKHNKGSKSDSSDADDEASKDLDSLDDQNHPRFSLSDNFRPASYYLGVSKSVPEFPDSSDSELVSPPPIPTSPPPLEDDEYNLDISKVKRLTARKESHFNRNSDQFFNSNNMKTPSNTNSPNRFSTQSLDTKVSFLSLKELKDRSTSFMYDGVEGSEDRFNRLSLNDDSSLDGPSNIVKRKPVSGEFFNQLNSYDDQLDNNNFQIYMRDMELPVNPELSHDYENLVITSKTPEKSNLDPCNTSKEPYSNKRSLEMLNAPLLTAEEFILRGRPSNNSSVSAEVCSFVGNSNCSTPVVSVESISIPDVPIPLDMQENFLCSPLTQQVAPYYYSDLSGNTSSTECNAMLTLNNQREQTNGSKKDITHIINPIKCNDQISNFLHSNVSENNSFTLAAEARSVSADFLNLTDKLGSIDKKNIYESDTLKRQKAIESSVQNGERNTEVRNLYLTEREKFNSNDLPISKTVRKSHSLEGLLENVLHESTNTTSETQDEASNLNLTMTEGSYIWEEDSVWRDRLRSVSQRHTKSLDDIDCLDDSEKCLKKSPRAITREVTYVNDILFKQDKSQEPQTKKFIKSAKNEIKKKGSFIIDREKLRQWDLLSSAPSDNKILKIATGQVPEGSTVVVELGEGSAPRDSDNPQDAASGSISIPRNAVELQRDTFPRVAKKVWPPNLQSTQALSTTNLERSCKYGPVPQSPYEMSQDMKKSRSDLPSSTSINVSAGELLGRTHEELVLLLIQLRRQSAQTFQAIESCYNEIDKLQACHNADQARRLENLQKLEKIKQNLLELEKQYEKGKPLVNLVDNMVKLGSLYRIPPNRNDMARYIRDRLEFNQHIQERRLLAEEKREWNRIETNQALLQDKVQQLYQLDQLIQEESENLQNLQQDKEDIERALGGLRCRLMNGCNNPEEIEQARRQQAILENELSRVHLMLAQNSKKLEESVAGNARLEHELLVLKQKLQISRQQRSSPQFSNPGDSLPFSVGTSAVLESDLKRVQKKIGDLHKQREELSLQVRQLTDRSNNIQAQQKMPVSCDSFASGKKKPSSVWRETDLDTMSIIDHGYSSDNTPNNSTTPLWINTDVKHGIPDSDYYERSLKSSDSTSDDTALSSNVLEKQEIKTVRIVKRESERRQRDREKSTATGKCDVLLEEDDSSQNSSVLFRPTSLQKPNSQASRLNSNKLNARPNNTEKSPELSPVFKSEAARQIITEVSVQDVPKVLRRTVPREKRRHYTAPNNNLIVENLCQLPLDSSRLDTRRARDDLDIERALRQRIDAPDIVRSTLSNKELKYNEETIDNILSTPNKIIIPERYIPEQLPQLSPEEQERRMRKVESIKKMLSDTAIISSATSSLHIDNKNVDKKLSPANKGLASASITEDKKQREHLLQLNQILAKQVMEMSKVVAVKNLAKLPLVPQQMSNEDEDSSPITPLPLYQQRENFYS